MKISETAEFKELIKLLNRAEQLAAQYSGGYSGQFLSAEEFHAALADSISKLENGDFLQLEMLNGWFLPTSCWDDFIGEPGQDLANDITIVIAKLRVLANRNDAE